MRFSGIVALFLGFWASLAWAGISPEAMSSRCQSGRHVVRTPRDVLAARGVRLENACPQQTQLDEHHECQDAATVLQNVYELLVEEREKTCRSALEATRQAERNCRGQQACVAAQAKALAIYEAALSSELELVRSYRQQVHVSVNYAVDRIAGEGAKMLQGVAEEARRQPRSRGRWATRFRAATNQEVHERVFSGDDPQKASAVVERFRKSEEKESDISGIKSEVLREPLRIALVGREWNRDLAKYEKELQGSAKALGNQRRNLADSGKKMDSLKPPKGQEGKPSSITQDTSGSGKGSHPSAGDGAGESAGANTRPRTNPSGAGLNRDANNALGAMTGLIGASGALAPLMASQQGSGALPNLPGANGAEGSGILSGERKDAKPGVPSSRLESVGQGKDKVEASALKTGEEKTESPRLGARNTGDIVSGSGIRENGRTGSSIAPGAGAKSGAPGQLSGGALAGAGGGTGSRNSGGKNAAYPGRDTGGVGGENGAYAEGGGGSDVDGFAEAAASAPGNNEIVVEGLVKQWEDSLGRGEEASEQAADIDPPGADSAALFLRAHDAHIRALKKGNLTRVVTADP